jgi:2'-5' RNA ligase
MHLTLHFEAEADETVAGRMRAALDAPIPVAPFRLTLSGLGMFPERGAPRVLWLDIREGRRELAAVHGEISRRLAAGQARRTRKEDFRPHLTLARFRDRVRRSDLAGLEAFRAELRSAPIDRVTLYESRLSPDGHAYTALAQALLEGTP